MSEATSAVEASFANVFRPPIAMIPCAIPSSASNVSQAFHFSSGNPRIKETRGFMHLYHNDFASSSLKLLVNLSPFFVLQILNRSNFILDLHRVV
ncbi:BRAP2 RING ZnF UBP domain-containing protein 2 [Camellia lanceoleosa]|uniref:BRAP2 RING ZnF UBP domain-containing protein 2 n=1 Tax=Camellia lanceoleosa TaxID=1840588 RepID=A0ACC0J054_9ERIC|nr:BRAP2 RING ZnF UBP domain-containing protein 2 [Camellia lanceoleosa]